VEGEEYCDLPTNSGKLLTSWGLTFQFAPKFLQNGASFQPQLWHFWTQIFRQEDFLAAQNLQDGRAGN